MAQIAERRMRLEVIVRVICLSSSLVDRVSEMRIRVPSERTTFSSGVIKKANGRLVAS